MTTEKPKLSVFSYMTSAWLLLMVVMAMMDGRFGAATLISFIGVLYTLMLPARA